MDAEVRDPPDLEARVRALGGQLGPCLAAVVEALDGAAIGPQRLSQELGLDKVFASRLLKAVERGDPIRVLHHVPGPAPLRRFLRAARRRGGLAAEVLEPAAAAVADFERFLEREVGDRAALRSLLAAWLPEARAEFELRRKQAAWRATSELRGATVDLDLSSVFLHPSADGERMDVTWVVGMVGLRRLRPKIGVKFSSRRIAPEGAARRPRDLDGAPLEGVDRGRLDEFCVAPPGEYAVHQAGDVLHYTLGGESYGPDAAVDLLFAEVNEAEIARKVARGSGRRGWVYSDVAVPARKLVLDVFVHDELYPGAAPELLLYDTAIRGVADVNDAGRDLDRLDLVESLVTLGVGAEHLPLPAFPRYPDLVGHVYGRLGWDPARFVLHRVEIDYPPYGMQVAVAFAAPER